MSPQRPDPLGDIADELLAARSPPPEAIECPICGGELRVHYETYRRRDRLLLGLGLNCETCGAAIQVDAIAPEWAEGRS